MTLMNSLIKSTTPAPPKMIVYGQPGVGKTTFAASAGAILLDCENGAGAVSGLTRTPYLQSWPQMRKWLVELADVDKADAPQALAIDTIDWMVQRIVEHVVLDLDGKSQGDITNTLGTAHGGYFKAREIVQNVVYRDLLPMLNAVADHGEVTVQYGERDEPESGDPEVFSFDTGGGTQHITQSLSTIGRYAASGTAPNFKGAIGVTHDNVEGVDITVPVYQFTETHYLPAAQVTPAYRGTLFYLTGKVNNASFRGLAAGECLFLGASGSQRGSGEDWEVTFKFAGSPNRTGITVGPITGIAKKGWEYLWVRYADAEDPASNTLESAVDPVAAPHKWQRPSIGQMIGATFGYAHYQDDGAGGLELVLGWINEIVDQEACETAGSSE